MPSVEEVYDTATSLTEAMNQRNLFVKVNSTFEILSVIMRTYFHLKFHFRPSKGLSWRAQRCRCGCFPLPSHAPACPTLWSPWHLLPCCHSLCALEPPQLPCRHCTHHQVVEGGHRGHGQLPQGRHRLQDGEFLLQGRRWASIGCAGGRQTFQGWAGFEVAERIGVQAWSLVWVKRCALFQTEPA